MATVPRSPRAILGGIVLLAAALRFATLDVQSFWADEAATAHLLRGGFGHVLSGVEHSESTPPLYYWLAWLWSKVFGTGEVGLRALSALFGTALVPVAWAMARQTERGGRGRAAPLAAVLVATNPLLVWFSQEARAYALLVLLVALSLLALLRALESPSHGRLGAWGAVAALAIATHYFAAFFVVGEVVWLVVALAPRQLPAALILPACSAAALAPLALSQRNADRANFIRSESLGTRLVQIPKQFLVGYDAPAEVLVTVIAAAAMVLIAALALRSRRETARSDRPSGPWRPLAAVTAGALLLPVLLAGAGNDYLITRNVVATLGALLVLGGVALALLPLRTGALLTGGLACVWAVIVIAVAVDPTLQRDDWRSATSALGAPAAPGRVVVVVPPSGAVAASLYLPGTRDAIPGQIAPATEIAVLAVAEQQRAGKSVVPPLPAQAPVPGFVPAGHRHGRTWAMVRFRVPQPVPVDAGSLGSAHAAVLVQQP
jgi:mannosyltransferase